MKKLVLCAIAVLALSIFYGCQEDELISQLADEQPQAVVKPDVYVENGYLVFKSKDVYDSIRFIVEKYEPEEALNWI